MYLLEILFLINFKSSGLKILFFKFLLLEVACFLFFINFLRNKKKSCRGTKVEKPCPILIKIINKRIRARIYNLFKLCDGDFE
jgi:hypothetical protein